MINNSINLIKLINFKITSINKNKANKTKSSFRKIMSNLQIFINLFNI
jgi:hypothetical protein